MKPTILSLSALALSLLSLPAQAAPEARRLIETTPGRVFWSTQVERDQLSEQAHANGRCGGFIDVTDFSASAVPVVSLLALDGLAPTQHATVTPLLGESDPAVLKALVEKLAAFHNRHYESQTGVDATNWIADQYRTIAAGRSDIQVEIVKHKKFLQPSVIARIQGSGANRDEIVVIGGHIDSINHKVLLSKKKAHAPGADDNASGTATVMETFRILVKSGFRPNRTIEFMGYAGEEAGLLGSQDIAETYAKSGKKVVGALQFDMTMYPGATPALTFINDHTDAGLNTFVKKVSDEYVKMPWRDAKCGYGCSDHASWNRSGFPATFPTEATLSDSNPKIHSAKDTAELLDFGFGTQFLKLSLAFAVELAQAGS